MKVANKCFENVAQLKYYGMSVTNKNWIHEEFKRRLNLGIVCCQAVHNLSSHQLSKMQRLKYKKLYLYSLFCIGVKHGLSHEGKNKD
jgi:hypothetical protein